MRWFWLFLFCTTTSFAQEADPVYVALEGGDVYTVTKGTLRGATVLIKDDKIHRVGRNLVLPEGTTRYDVSGERVLPGSRQAIGQKKGPGLFPLTLLMANCNIGLVTCFMRI